MYSPLLVLVPLDSPDPGAAVNQLLDKFQARDRYVWPYWDAWCYRDQNTERIVEAWRDAAYTRATLPARGLSATGVITPDGELHDCRPPQPAGIASTLLDQHPSCHVIAVDIHT